MDASPTTRPRPPLRAWRSEQEGRPTVPLPPAPMPAWLGTRPLKRWRWVGAFDAHVALCVATVRVGPLPVTWWAVWDRATGLLTERTLRRRDAAVLRAGRVTVADPRTGADADHELAIDLRLHERGRVETVSPHGPRGYAWTAKQAGIAVTGIVAAAGRRHVLTDALAVVDDSAGYHARRTAWHWSAGVGTGPDGRPVGWNLCAGLHDDPAASENTVWLDGRPHALGTVRFDGLHAVVFETGERLAFVPGARRARRDDLGLVASDYEAPFGTFTGSLPGIGDVRDGRGVMERHTARW